LATVISAFKSISAHEVNAILGRTGQLWQRSYFERVVRNDAELNRIRRYILDNPARWLDDKNYVQP
jgi:REP element-mobilizing transposase RayT